MHGANFRTCKVVTDRTVTLSTCSTAQLVAKSQIVVMHRNTRARVKQCNIVAHVQRIGFKLGLKIYNPEICSHFLTVYVAPRSVFLHKHPIWVKSRPVLCPRGKCFPGIL